MFLVELSDVGVRFIEQLLVRRVAGLGWVKSLSALATRSDVFLTAGTAASMTSLSTWWRYPMYPPHVAKRMTISSAA